MLAGKCELQNKTKQKQTNKQKKPDEIPPHTFLNGQNSEH